MYSQIMGHLGTDAVAANSIATIVKNLIACFCIGLATGGGIMVGNELGSGALDRAKDTELAFCRMSVIAGAVSGLLIVAMIPLILHAVDLSPEALEYLMWMLIMCSYYMIGKSVNMTTISGIFVQAAIPVRAEMRCSDDVACLRPAWLDCCVWLHLPVIAVYCIINFDEMLKLPAVYRNYKKYRWVKDLTRNGV